MMSEYEARIVWDRAVSFVKDRTVSPTLYTALEASVGITLDGDEFVIGFSSEHAPMAGHLRSTQHHAVIEQALFDVLRQHVRLKVIDGSTLAEYEAQKQVRNMADLRSNTASAQRESNRATEQEWEAVGEKITRSYAKLPNRGWPIVRAEFMREAFKMIAEAVDAHQFTMDSDDVHKRALARVFEKFATAVEAPSAMLAYEFFRLRDEGKL